MSKEKIYGVADKAWQVVVGCDPHMKCAPRCWARRTVTRIVECRKGINCAVEGTFTPCRATFFRGTLTPDLKQWRGRVLLDAAHLADPLHWRKPALVATGFHGDWGRLHHADKLRMLDVMEQCPRHTFMPLTKEPLGVLAALRHWFSIGRRPLPNVTIGCSIMDQRDADTQWSITAQIATRGWATHVWYEPAIGPVNWAGWEFLRGIIQGGERPPMRGQCTRSGRAVPATGVSPMGVPFNFQAVGRSGRHAPASRRQGI